MRFARRVIAVGMCALFGSAAVAEIDYETMAFKACAAEVGKAFANGRIELVKRVSHEGSGNYEFWFNSYAGSVGKSYCHTTEGSVARVQHSDGQWTRNAGPLNSVASANY